MTMPQTLSAHPTAPAVPIASANDDAPHDAFASRDAFAADEGQVRHDLIIRVRRQIELGIYDEDQRIDALLDRLMEDLAD